MARLVKILLLLVAGVIGLGIVASVALLMFFDPNDFRQDIADRVKTATGRELVIEGDLSLSIFPWLAIEIGRTELGNAAGFSEKPFLSFDSARLSVRMLPLIVRQEITVGTAALDGLLVNLEVAADGSSNWDDFSDVESSAPGGEAESAGEPKKVDVASISVSDANVFYADAQTGSTYAMTNMSFSTGVISSDQPVDMDAELDFSVAPGEIGGHLEFRSTITMAEAATQISVEGLNVSGTLRGIADEPTDFNFDSRAVQINTVEQRASLGEMDISVLGMSMSAVIEPFSYAGPIQPQAELRVAEFSLKELMTALGIEAPLTADPDALGRVSFNAMAVIGEDDISLATMTLELDDSTMVGSLSLPMSESGSLRFDLNVDAINLDGYMAPTDEAIAAAESADSGDMEIPVDMIRALNASGSFKIDRALLSGMEFTNLQLGLNSANGRLRLYPLSAELYDGTYNGDVQIDAANDVPSISVNENIAGVNLASLAKSMFDQENISGSINGSFVLSGSGRSVAEIRQDLDGNMSFELVDGAWEGTDVWHELRAARAMFRQEPAPEPRLPARTEFTTVSASGTVLNGIFENNDLFAELPFMQITGNGLVDLPAAQINYSVQARVLERPEFVSTVSAEELADFTKASIPLKITGPLSAPNIQPDIEALLRQQVDQAIEDKTEELKNRLFDRLLKNDADPANEEATDEEAVEEESLEEQLKNKLLKDLIGN
jgi:AsmA protein